MNKLPLAMGPATDIHHTAKDPAVTPAALNPAALMTYDQGMHD